jgi:small subunit ribosomal protein S15
LQFWGFSAIVGAMLDVKQKQKVIDQFKVHQTDSGSPEVQVGLLSEEIRKLLLHLKKHAKDFHSKRGLLKMVAKRRTLLGYLKREDDKRYKSLVKKVGLKK